MKVVINKCFGGFGLSHKAVMRYAELAGYRLYPWIGHIERESYKERAVFGNADLIHHYSRVPLETLPRDEYNDPRAPSGSYWYEGDLERADPILVRVVEEMGTDADGRYAKLAVVDIPDGTDFTLEDYDGQEHIAEAHKTWS